MENLVIKDILVNLISEALGILVTVLIIDRILEHREQARWHPSKNMVYADLLKIISSLLEKVLPQSLWQHILGLYSFGSASSSCGIKIEKKNISIDDIYLHLKSTERATLERDAALTLSYLKQLDDILIRWAFLIEPELLSLVLELTKSIQMHPKSIGDDEKFRFVDQLAIALSMTNFRAIEVLNWLEKKANSYQTFDDFNKKVKEHYL